MFNKKFYILIILAYLCTNIANNGKIYNLKDDLKDDESLVLIFLGLGDSCLRNVNKRFFNKNFPKVKFVCNPYNSTISDIESIINKTCDFLKKNEHVFKKGFSVLGFSQGGLIGRSALQVCEMGKYAKTLVTIASPHMGVSKIPFTGWNIFLNFFIKLCKLKLIRNYLEPCSYYWSQDDEKYNKSSFIGQINNLYVENKQYKERILNLKRFVMTWNKNDKMITPKITAKFGMLGVDNKKFVDINYSNSFYSKNDRLGLLELQNQGKLSICGFSGGHMSVDNDFFNEDMYQILDYKRDYEIEFLNKFDCNYRL